jgi:hypothetical protein
MVHGELRHVKNSVARRIHATGVQLKSSVALSNKGERQDAGLEETDDPLPVQRQTGSRRDSRGRETEASVKTLVRYGQAVERQSEADSLDRRSQHIGEAAAAFADARG